MTSDLPNQNITIGQNIQVSGTVVNQNGQPINNATVQVLGVDYDQLTPSASETKDQLANADLTDAVNKTPTLWEEQVTDDFQLLGSTGHISEVESTYVAVHRRSDWARDRTGQQVRQNPDLENPLLDTGSTTDGSVTLALSIWDVRKEQGPLLENNVDEQLPGKPATGRVTIETLLAVDPAFETTTARVRFDPDLNPIGNFFATQPEYNNAFLLVDVTPGFYKVYPEGNPGAAYVVKVGDPMEFFSDRVENANGDVSEQASDVANKLNSGRFTRTTTTTASDGTWSVDVGSAVNRVEVQAYKAPDVAVNDSDLDVATIIEDYQSGDAVNDFGSVYLPSDTKRVSPPESGVEIELVEISYPPYGNLSKLSEKLEDDFQDQLNESLTTALSTMQQDLSELNQTEVENLLSDYQDLVEQNQQLEDRLRELLDDGEETTVDPGDVNRDELESRIADLEDAFNQLENSITSGTPTSTSGQETVSVAFPFDANLGEENVLVLAHWSNGTTDRLDTSSEYVSIDSRIGQGDVVRITDYPLGDDDANAVTFEVLVSTPGGLGSSAKAVTNPTFSNDVPEIESISLTSLRPGAGQKVDVEVTPEESATFGSLTSVAVTGPDGAALSTDAIGADGLTTGFTPQSAGVHRIELQFNNSEGDVFTEVVRITAEETDQARGAGVQPVTGVTGLFVLVGDGIDGGSVETNADGSQVTMNAQVDVGEQPPGTVHYYSGGLESAPETRYTLRVVRGESERSISRSVGVVLHSPSITTDSPILYRQGDQPIPREGSNRFGQVEKRANGTVIETFTESDGAVQLTVNNDPSLVDSAFYRGRLALDGVPFIGGGALIPAGFFDGLARGVGA